MNKNLDQRKFLREKEVSEIYGINPNTLRRQRWGDYGIPYSVVGRAKNKKKGGIVRYDVTEIEEYLSKNRKL